MDRNFVIPISSISLTLGQIEFYLSHIGFKIIVKPLNSEKYPGEMVHLVYDREGLMVFSFLESIKQIPLSQDDLKTFLWKIPDYLHDLQSIKDTIKYT